MEIQEVTKEYYSNIINNPNHIFGLPAFNDLNRKKCKKVYYLLFRDSRYRLGLIGGIKDDFFLSPFSAPFNGFSYLSSDIKLRHIEDAIIALEDWAFKNKLKKIRLILPPAIYSPDFLTKQINCFWRHDYLIKNIDLNYSFNLSFLDSNYPDNIWRNARKNLNTSFKSGFIFEKCETREEQKKVYDIIYENRKLRGFPLRMCWEQVQSTIEIIHADFFILKSIKNELIASAIVFYVVDNIVQVIYWGDLPEFSSMRPMNFLSYKLFEYYKNMGISIVDLGPSTENSVPNYGLAEFKESIGCSVEPKYTIEKIFS